MAEWTFAQTQPGEELAILQHFSVKKHQGAREIEFIITVKEFATPKEENLKFFALADKQTNQKTAPFTPCGWGNTLLRALAECIQNIHRFPYEGA